MDIHGRRKSRVDEVSFSRDPSFHVTHGTALVSTNGFHSVSMLLSLYSGWSRALTTRIHGNSRRQAEVSLLICCTKAESAERPRLN